MKKTLKRDFRISIQVLFRYLPDKFILGLFLMIVMAYFFPGVGMRSDHLSLETIINFGISFIFFFYGLKLSPAKFRAGLTNWKLHIAVQALTFLIFPVLVLPFYALIKSGAYEELWLAVFFLAVLPSTVSSSVVMVSIARGNIPAAIFNASISGIIGIFITPLWMGIFLDAHSEAFSFADVVVQLIIQILLPVLLGLLLNRFFGKWAERYKIQLGTFDKVVILLIVYKSFSNSFESGIFNGIRIEPLLVLFAGVVVLFFAMIFVSGKLADLMAFSREDKITTIFCGTKKSLVHGSVMYNVLFAAVPSGGIFLVPIMIYHAFQLFYISIIARNMRLKTDSLDAD